MVGLDVEQTDGTPAQLTVTLQNDVGQYAGLAALRRNARLRLSLGYVGGGVIPTHVCYVDDWRYERAADRSLVVVSARDARAWLDRAARAPLVYSGRTVDWLTREVLARSGLLAVQLPTTAQFGQSVATFHVPAGQTWATALGRLSRLYGYDAVAWSYGDEVDGLAVQRSGERANHVLVFGAAARTGPDVIGEAWDWADVGEVAQERYLQVVDSLIPTSAAAAVCAGLRPAREERAAVAGEVTAALHAGLELWDVLSVADGRIGVTRARVWSLRHRYEPQAGVYDLRVGIEGP